MMSKAAKKGHMYQALDGRNVEDISIFELYDVVTKDDKLGMIYLLDIDSNDIPIGGLLIGDGEYWNRSDRAFLLLPIDWYKVYFEIEEDEDLIDEEEFVKWKLTNGK